jgi:hypothetical protein
MATPNGDAVACLKLAFTHAMSLGVEYSTANPVVFGCYIFLSALTFLQLVVFFVREWQLFKGRIPWTLFSICYGIMSLCATIVPVLHCTRYMYYNDLALNFTFTIITDILFAMGLGAYLIYLYHRGAATVQGKRIEKPLKYMVYLTVVLWAIDPFTNIPGILNRTTGAVGVDVVRWADGYVLLPFCCMIFCDFVYTIQFFITLVRIRKMFGEDTVMQAMIIARYGFVTSLLSMSCAAVYAIELATQQELNSWGAYSVLMLTAYVLIFLVVLSLSLQKRALDRRRYQLESKPQRKTTQRQQAKPLASNAV